MSTHSDRTWMYNKFTVDSYHDKYFEIKVDEFLDFAYSIVANVDTRNINGETFYRWDAAKSNQICDAWESHIGKRYSDIMRCVRKAAMKATRVNDNVDIRRISSNRPNWIGANNWPTMVEAWDTDECRHAVKLFKTMFKGAYATWTQVPQDHRDRCFSRFKLSDVKVMFLVVFSYCCYYNGLMCNWMQREIRILKKQNDDLTKKMEEERVAAKAQREADLPEWKQTLDDRFGKSHITIHTMEFSHVFPRINHKFPTEFFSKPVGKMFVENPWEITVGTLWQKKSNIHSKCLGNLWEIIVGTLWQKNQISVANQLENVCGKSVGNDCGKSVAKKRDMCGLLLLEIMGNPWEKVNAPWENPWENI
ncbi:hypothetical protein Tco_0700928 [Tanacetum coccineum]